MNKFKNFEELSIFLINKISEIFANHAILKGGMVFKILGSPRYTNDIDYTFIPYKSKKQIKDLILKKLEDVLNVKIKFEINSKCIRYFIMKDNINIQIEINTATECKSIELSTLELSKKNNQTARIIRAISYDQALSQKLAAWNERNLIRDLFDIYFLFYILDEKPDIKLLKKRLSKIDSLINKKEKSITLNDFILKLEKKILNLNAKEIYNELNDYFPKDELIGLDKKLKIGLKKLIDFLKEFI